AIQVLYVFCVFVIIHIVFQQQIGIGKIKHSGTLCLRTLFHPVQRELEIHFKYPLGCRRKYRR
ncbi:hypothetical protein P3677_26345, partial [Vibrio parahaemolyticus]|nr:hypothetical protein [Vibrio parahaemolyticus]